MRTTAVGRSIDEQMASEWDFPVDDFHPRVRLNSKQRNQSRVTGCCLTSASSDVEGRETTRGGGAGGGGGSTLNPWRRGEAQWRSDGSVEYR